MDDFREALKSAMAEQQSETDPVEASTEVDADSASEQATHAEKSALTQYEIGGKTYKSWDEAKKWGDNVASLYGKQAKELGETRRQIEDAKEAIEWYKQLKATPDLQKGVREVYDAFNKKIAEGGTQAQATKAADTVAAKFDEKTQAAIDWILELQGKYNAEDASEAVDAEVDELKKFNPKISEKTIQDVYSYVLKHPTLSLVEAYNAMMGQISAKKAAGVKDTGVPGKMGSVEVGPQKPNLKNANDAKKHIRDILNEG